MSSDGDRMPAAAILKLGDPRLRHVSMPVKDFNDPDFIANRKRLHATLSEFRSANGFGRAVSAPQVGVAQRFIAINMGSGPSSIVNPEVVWRSPETFTMWDDCMSFPSLLVRLRRHRSISLRFVDELGRPQEWLRMDQAASELLQHEIDHLDGILAIDRAIDRESVVLREAFQAQPAHFAQQVDYVIGGENRSLEIKIDDLTGSAIAALLREHLQNMFENSPPESVHALNIEQLRKPGITFWSVWNDADLLGCGALKELDSQHGEIKSMRTVSTHRRKGVAARLLQHILDEARKRNYKRVSLETGSMEAFGPAQRLYARFGFQLCPPFADYIEDPNSLFMTKEL